MTPDPRDPRMSCKNADLAAIRVTSELVTSLTSIQIPPWPRSIPGEAPGEPGRDWEGSGGALGESQGALGELWEIYRRGKKTC